MDNNVGGTTVANGGVLSLSGGGAQSFVNLGTLQATARRHAGNLGGTFTTADLGGFVKCVGGTIAIAGSLNNASGLLARSEPGGVYTLVNSGLITGGTVEQRGH